jgi:hypothetical protein
MIIEFQTTGPKLVEVMHARMQAVRPCIADALFFGSQIYHVAWIDVGNTSLALSNSGTGYILNELIQDKVKSPMVGGVQVLLQRLQVMQQITVHVCTRTAMKASNEQQAPTTEVGMQLKFDLQLRVSEEGQPRLCAIVSDVQNVSAPLDQSAKDALVALLQDRVSTCIPLSIAPLANVTGGDTPRVFNVGIAANASRSIVCLRFETVPPDAGAKARWESFYDGGFVNRLHGRDWSLLIPKQLMEAAVAQVLADNLAGNSQFSLQSSVNAVWAPLGDVPQMLVTFNGEIIDACIGIDLDVDVTIGVLFTSPQANVLRTSIVLGWDGDFWEEVACEFVSAMLWPVVGIMFVSEGKIDWGAYFGGLAFGPAAIFFGIVGYLSTDEPASNIPAPANWVKDSDTGWHQDQAFPGSVGGITGLSMNLAAADPEGLVLAGSIALAKPLIPTLKTLPHPFTGWTLSRPCHSLYEMESEASIGIIADPMGVFPRLPLRLCGVQVINDQTGFYSNSSYPGGSIQNSTSYHVELKNPPTNWQQNPYDLEVLIFSNQGCRLITIASPGLPPKVSDDPQEKLLLNIAWIGWKATHCWKFTTIWGAIGKLNPEWLIDPPPYETVAQHWWIELKQAVAGDRITLRDQFGADLMTSVVDADGHAVVTGIIENAAEQSTVWLARNGARISTAEFRDFSRRVATPETEPTGSITVKQTLLQLRSEIALALPAQALAFDYQAGVPKVFLATAAGLKAFSVADPGRPALTSIIGGTSALHFRPLGGRAGGAAVYRSTELDPLACGRVHPAASAKGSCDEPDPKEFSDCRCERPTRSAAEPEREAARSVTQPWYSGGARLGRLYVRLADGGRRVRIYRILHTHLGLERHPTLEEIQGASEDSRRA